MCFHNHSSQPPQRSHCLEAITVMNNIGMPLVSPCDGKARVYVTEVNA